MCVYTVVVQSSFNMISAMNDRISKATISIQAVKMIGGGQFSVLQSIQAEYLA